MKRLAILGAGGHGKVVADIAVSSGWKSVEFYDDVFPIKSSKDGLTIQGSLEMLLENTAYYDGFHVAIGDNKTRLNILNRFLELDLPCPNIIATSSVISQSVSLGNGISVMANVVVGPKTTLGNAVILNTSCSVEHDCNISAGAHISPGAHLAGDVSVGICTWIGIGSSIIQGKIIGDRTIIGAGSVVISDVPKNVTAIGVPSKIIEC